MAVYGTTPQATDAYSRMWVDLYDEREQIPSSAGFQAFFGRPETGAVTGFSEDAGVVDIDIIRGNERLAKMVPRSVNGRSIGSTQQNTQEQRYTTVSRLWPLVYEEGDISSDQLLFRVAGENPYEERRRLDRMRILARGIHIEHMRRISRTFEFLAAQSIITGSMPAIIGTSDANYIYDFYRNTSNTQNAALPWTNSAQDPIADLDIAWNQIRSTARTSADMVIFAGDVMAAFLTNPFVTAPADIRRFEFVEVNDRNPVPARFARFVAGGFTARARVLTYEGHEIWIFTYADQYDDDAGDPQKYMPNGSFVMASSRARCDRFFGPPAILPNIPMREQFYAQMFGFSATAPPRPPQLQAIGSIFDPAWLYFDAYAPVDWQTVTIRTQAAPIFVTTQTDAFFTMNQVVT